MHLDPTQRAQARTSPMQIAHNPLFTAREKIEILNELKAEISGEAANPDNLGFELSEIDAAISEIHRETQNGDRPLPAFMEAANERLS